MTEKDMEGILADNRDMKATIRALQSQVEYLQYLQSLRTRPTTPYADDVVTFYKTICRLSDALYDQVKHDSWKQAWETAYELKDYLEGYYYLGIDD